MKIQDPPRTILIAGPTASGKSALALALAERLGGVIINADSMQVYRELRVLSARPTEADEARAPHRLYGHVGGHEAYSAGRFMAEAAREIGAAHRDGRVAIVTGGTGLYFKALTEGLSPIPAIPDDVRAFWRAEAARLGAGALHAELARRDPAMAARLSSTDPQRVTRALEVIEATGRSLADWQSAPGQPVVDATRSVRLVVMPGRAELYRRCDLRFEAMLAAGAAEEVRALVALGLDPELPVMRALGVVPLAAMLAGAQSREAAVERGKLDTRHYAKRQLTWLRRNMISWKHFNTQEMKSYTADIIAFMQD